MISPPMKYQKVVITRSVEKRPLGELQMADLVMAENPDGSLTVLKDLHGPVGRRYVLDEDAS